MNEMTRRERALRCFRFEPADRLCMDGQFRPEVWGMLEAHFGTKDRGVIAGELGLGFMKEVTRRPDPRWLERAQETDELVAVLDLLEEHHVELARIYGDLGYDVLCIWGDLAMQTTTLFDPRLWRKHFKPRMARVIETAREHGVPYVFFHSDGNNMPLENLLCVYETVKEVGPDFYRG